jgi:hypothetical protein
MYDFLLGSKNHCRKTADDQSKFMPKFNRLFSDEMVGETFSETICAMPVVRWKEGDKSCNFIRKENLWPEILQVVHSTQEIIILPYCFVSFF